MYKPSDSVEQAIVDACNELAETLISKGRKYGNTGLLDFGEIGVLIRLSDKQRRLKKMIKGDMEDTQEPVEDSWLDSAGYSILGLLLRRGNIK